MFFWDVLVICQTTFTTPGTFSRIKLNSAGIDRNEGGALDERGFGIDAILVTILETAAATVKHVIITAARGWRFAASCLP